MIPLRTVSAAKLIIGFLFSFTLFILYGQSHFYRDPGSAFYDRNRAYEQQYSAVRLDQVEHFRNVVKHNDAETYVQHAAQGLTPEICVTMTTFFRRDLERQYIEDALLSMLDKITAQERSLLHLNLLFTDVNATVHPSWHKPWLHNMLDDVWSYDDDDKLVTPELHSWLEGISPSYIKTKAIMDYTLALQKCLDRTDAPFIAAIEGDTLFASGWVAPTLRALKSADKHMKETANFWWSSRSEQRRDWLFMRLFNQERSTGWGSREIGGNNELVIVLVIDIVVSLVVLILRSRNVVSINKLDNPSLAVICLLIVPVSVVSFFKAGKASLLPPKPGLAVESFGCCSQALIFKRDHVPNLIAYLRGFALQEAEGKVDHANYDIRTKDFANDNGLDTLALYPMQVQHMGIESALGTAHDEAQSVWSMAFETLDDADVTARHDIAMDELFGRDWREAS